MTTPANITTSTTTVAANKLLTPQTGTLAVAPQPTGGQGLSLTPNNQVPKRAVRYSDYTPAWTSTGTAPAVGNATLVGRWAKIGTYVTGEIIFIAGSTTTYGTNLYRWSLPVVAAEPHGGFPVLGSGYIFDSATSNLWTIILALQSTTTVAMFFTATAGNYQVGATNPFTFTSGGQMKMCFDYEGTV